MPVNVLNHCLLTREERDLKGKTPRLFKNNAKLCFMIGYISKYSRKKLYKPSDRRSPTIPYALRIKFPLLTTLAGQGFSRVSCPTSWFTAELSKESFKE